jgi:hypothetical protein
MPVDSDLINLLDYDFDITEYGWEDAGFSIAHMILGSDRDDDEFAEMLVEAFLAGANKYDIPLPCDFRDDVSKEQTVDEMRQDFYKAAVTFIKD